MDNGRDCGNVIQIIGGDEADNRDDKPVSGYDNGEGSGDTTSNITYGGDAVAMKRSMVLAKMLFKTQMCQEFMSGNCQNYANCKFAHAIEELRTPQQNYAEFGLAREDRNQKSFGFVVENDRSYKSRYCKKFYSEAGCPFGDNCTYIHDEDSKTRESMAIIVGPRSGGGYRNGGVTGNSGGLAAPSPTLPLAAAATPQLAPLPLVQTVSNATMKPLNWRTRICSRWEQSGYCQYGSKCFFAHGDVELQGYGGGPVEKEGNTNNQRHMVPNVVAAYGSSVARIVAASGSSVARAGGSGQLSGAARRPWKGPDKISRIYGDWIDDIE